MCNFVSRETDKILELWPSRPEIQYELKVESTIWGKHKKYMRRRLLEILSGHMMRGRLRRPPPCVGSSCGPLLFVAFAYACIFLFRPTLYLYFLFLPHIVFSVFGPHCILWPVSYQLPCICKSMQTKVCK